MFLLRSFVLFISFYKGKYNDSIYHTTAASYHILSNSLFTSDRIISRCIFYWLYSPCVPWPLFQSLTIGRTPWTSDQLVARPLPKHRTAQTQYEHIYTPNIHALSEIRTHDHSVPASEDSPCLRSLGYRDRQFLAV
jgi:hypothetical protein